MEISGQKECVPKIALANTFFRQFFESLFRPDFRMGNLAATPKRLKHGVYIPVH